jgi:hypothetical protein
MRVNRNAALRAFLSLGICASSFAYGQAADHVPSAGFRVITASDEIPTVPSRVVAPVDVTKLVRLHGNMVPMARAENDKGRIEPATELWRMHIVLKRSAEQDAALEKFMEEQQDPKSSNFHNWLDAEQFGKLYGPSDADVAAVTNWLKNAGLTVEKVTKGRIFIEFRGTAAQVENAFHFEMHDYLVGGVHHTANNTDPSIPEALTPVVAGIFQLNDFWEKPLHKDLGTMRRNQDTGKWTPLNPEKAFSQGKVKPMYNVPVSGGDFELVTPFDFATIYNVLPLWNAGITGTGLTIGIAGRSDISLTDVATFRKAFDLPVNVPTITQPDGDPGTPSADDRGENSLDVEWSGAVAPEAKINLVAFSNANGGSAEAALYIIDNKLAPIMSFSYGACELIIGTSVNAAYGMLWQQGASEGISEFVASGDQGSAACDAGENTPTAAQYGLAVSGSSSTPYDIAVGGTDFEWATNGGGPYWSTTNDPTTGASALGYIPEVPWNGSCASLDVDALIGAPSSDSPEDVCNAILPGSANADLDYLLAISGGTGGKSNCTTNNTTSSTTTYDPSSCSGGWSKPSWQTGTGVPADGKRDVPDLSLFASEGALHTAYAICDTDDDNGKDLPCTYSNPTDALAQAFGGTSVASPSMAGIMALVEQHAGQWQGLPNKTFYSLAAKDDLSSCNSSNGSGASCIFNDITFDNIAVPCIYNLPPNFTSPTPDCAATTSTDEIGIIKGYSAGTGYDLATGLGSVNAANLVAAWPATTSKTTATLSPSTLAFANTLVGSTSATMSATLKNTGTATLTISTGGITVSGTGYKSFVPTATTCNLNSEGGGTLAAGASCTLTLEFAPTTTGLLTATLAIADNASVSPQKTTLTGTGEPKSTSGSSITLTPTSLTFPNTTKGATSEAQPVTVKNTGTATVTLHSISTSPASFVELNTCGTSLAAGKTCTVFVAFKPAAAGALKGTLSVSDTASGTPQTATLSGTGTAADSVTLSTKSLTFAAAKGTTSEAQSVTVSNKGTSTLDITNIALSGLQASAFTELNTCGPTLAPATSCVIDVAFKPAATGSFAASLVISDNGSTATQTVTLKGTEN